MRKRPYLQDGRSQRGSRTRRPCFPSLLTLRSYPLSYHIFLQLCTLHQMSHTNTQVYFFRSSFPMKVPMSHKTCKKSLCPFLFLSFVTGAPAKNFEEWRSHSSKAYRANKAQAPGPSPIQGPERGPSNIFGWTYVFVKFLK